MNESPYPPPKLAVEYASKYLQYMNMYYVEDLGEQLLGELEKYTGVPREHIVFLPGSSHALTLMVALAKVEDTEIVMPHPTFHALYSVLRGFKVPFKLVKLLDGFKLDEDNFLRLSEGRLVYIALPNNPTSNLLVEDLEYISRLARVARYVFLDEAYYEFSGFTAKDLVLEHGNLVILRSFSKAFSLAGVRFGYILAGKGVLKRLNSLRIGYETSIVTQAAALGALRDREYVERVVAEVKANREYVRKKLVSAGFKSPESSTNFVLVDLGKPCKDTWRKLREKSILTLCLELIEDFVGYENYLRVTVGRREDMEFFLETLLSET